MTNVTLASLQGMRRELVNSRYYLNIRSGYMAPVTLHCSYGDSGETVTFYIFDGGDELDLTGSSVTVHGTRKDGANFGPFACVVNGNAVSFELQATMTAVEGGGIAEFTISKSGTTIGTCNFGLMVEDAVFPNGVAYDSDPSVYQDILTYVQSIPASITYDYTSKISLEASARQEAVNAEANARANAVAGATNEIAVERARIDNYLKSGTAASNSELVDIRVKADGTTATSAGNAVREQISSLQAAAGPLNMFDPSFTYTQTNINGVAVTGYTVNSSGVITTTRSYAGNGSQFLVTNDITITAWKVYTITARITIDSNLTPTSNQCVICIGRSTSYTQPQFIKTMKTTRNGNTDVSIGDRVGWITATFHVPVGGPLAFELLPLNASMGNGTYPATFDNVIITESSGIVDYTSETITGKDVIARGDIQAVDYATKGSLIVFNSKRITFSANGQIVYFPDDVYFVGGYPRKVAHTIEEIHADIPSNTTITNDVLALTMPDLGTFGYNTRINKFEMLTGDTGMFVTDPEFMPLYSRYYGQTYGKLAEKYVFDSARTLSVNAIDDDTFAAKCAEFSALFSSDVVNNLSVSKDIESFLFFTDPHLVEGTWQDIFKIRMSDIRNYYQATPTSFCLCGGDWLGNSDLPAEASFKLGYIDGYVKSNLDKCYMLVGNHDTNYQGKKDSSSETYTTRLSNDSLVDLWYREEGKTYFTFDGMNTRFYCFDTGTENQAMTDYSNYGWEQALWFANALKTDNSPHIAITAHILYYESSSTNVQPLTNQILLIAQAYNSRTSISVNGTSFNYSSATGKVEFFIGGHLHSDATATINSIPCVVTTWVRAGNTATFDLVFVDYEKRVINLVRVGNGSSRTVTLT